MARWQWLLTIFTRKLWLRVSVIAVIGVATAAAGIVFAPYVPEAWTISIGAQAIDSILNVLASSMLAVTVFSVSTMVSAYAAATSNVTPRATKLLLEDKTSQNVLGTFVGSFLFSLVGIIALSTGLYGAEGRAILLVVTVGLIALIAMTILRWIDYLAKFGRLGETIQRVEEATWKAMKARLKAPHLGGRPLTEAPKESWPVFSSSIGYVQHLDVSAIEDCVSKTGNDVFVTALPGAFADPARPVALVSGAEDAELGKAIGKAYTIGEERSFDQDPRFGLCVLAEIASRALSPAVNDAGTAIDVIGRGVRLLTKWSEYEAEADEPDVACPHVRVPSIAVEDMLDDIFAPIERDGAGVLEVQVRLQKAFIALTVTDRVKFDAARRHSAVALKRAEAALSLPEDRRTLHEVAATIGQGATGKGEIWLGDLDSNQD